jgi:hypothetical protein
MTTSYYDVSTQLRGKERRERRLGDSRSRCTCVVSVDAILLRTDLFRLLCPRVHSLKYIVYCCMSLLTCRVNTTANCQCSPILPCTDHYTTYSARWWPKLFEFSEFSFSFFPSHFPSPLPYCNLSIPLKLHNNFWAIAGPQRTRQGGFGFANSTLACVFAARYFTLRFLVHFMYQFGQYEIIQKKAFQVITVAVTGWTSSVSCVASLGDCWGWDLRA